MRITRIILVIAAVSMPASVWAMPIAVGSEFQVNTYTTGDQSLPSVATDRSGNFVVVWQGASRDGSGLGVVGRRFDDTGAAAGGEFQVNTYTTGDQVSPVVAMDGSGDFVVVWQSAGQDGSGTGIFGRRYDATGAPMGGEFQVNTHTTDDQFGPAVAMNDTGDFVVAWSGLGLDGSGFGNRGQRFDSNGVPVGGEFQINTFTTSWQSEAAVAMNDSGEFVVAWRSWYQDGSAYGVFGQRFDSAGFKHGGEFQVNLYTAGHQYGPAVGMDDPGNLLVAWQSDGQDGSGDGVFYRHFDIYGQGSVEGIANTHYAGDQRHPALAMAGLDNFLMVWESDGQDGSGLGIFGQNWDTPGPEFQVNTYTTGAQSEPAVAVSDSGDIVVAWQSSAQDGSGSGIFARRYTCYDMDGDGLCDFADVVLTSPADGATLSCLDPRTTRPTIQWDAGNYDRFRVFLSADPTFLSSAAGVSSGDTLLRTTYWTPSTKKWRSACRKAVAANPFSPELFVRVLGVDRDLPKSDLARKTYSQVIQVDVQP